MDKYSALWISYSKINQFQRCPRAYYLNNIYRNPKTGRKITIISPSLALGQIVHEVVEGLSVLPVHERFKEPLMTKYNKAWEKISGKRGGFRSKKQEAEYKERGANMLRRILNNPGPIEKKALKIRKDPAYFWLSEKDGIILSGKIDWMEYIPEQDAIHIIDFKTSKLKEPADSLQLPIYYLLASKLQQRKVVKASYWYLEFADQPTEIPLPPLEEIETKVLEISKNIKLAHKLNAFKCPHGEDGCMVCKPFEKILNNEAEYIGLDEYGKELYIVNNDQESKQETELDDSYIL